MEFNDFYQQLTLWHTDIRFVRATELQINNSLADIVANSAPLRTVLPDNFASLFTLQIQISYQFSTIASGIFFPFVFAIEAQCSVSIFQ